MFEGRLIIDVSQNFENVLYRVCDALKQLSVVPNGENPERVKQNPDTAQAPAAVTPAPAPIENVPNAASVPVAQAPTYTLTQISKAGAELLTADPSKMSGLQGLLAQFNVAAIPELKEEQFGAFATALRELGANI